MVDFFLCLRFFGLNSSDVSQINDGLLDTQIDYTRWTVF
jgi:hypothetical protein